MPDHNQTVFLLTLGCEKNRVDGEAMGGLLREAGYPLTEKAEEAEIIIVNTCGFIQKAVKESIDAILTLAEHKRGGICKVLAVTGCMAERYRGEIMREIPETDAVLGVAEYYKIAETIQALTEPAAQEPLSRPDAEAFYAKRLRLPVSPVMPVKIAEGCGNHCTYCTIPRIRGPYHSRPFESIVQECAKLTELGARELVLVAQDTALYGTDLYGKPRLPELIDEISRIEKLSWVRVMYAYPEHITPGLITAIAGNEKACHYIDMPIQHSHDAVLKRMGRQSSEKNLRQTIHALRSQIPDIILRTTLITGFPGETDEEYEHLRAFVQDIRFDRLGVFAYSREEGTPAAKMKPQVKSSVKKQRYQGLMELQQNIHREKQKNLTGQTLTVMTDAVTEAGGAYECEGRTYRDAYETDSVVIFSAQTPPAPGDLIKVAITGSDGYDLKGTAVDGNG